jgi:hypothetical protein
LTFAQCGFHAGLYSQKTQANRKQLVTFLATNPQANIFYINRAYSVVYTTLQVGALSDNKFYTKIKYRPAAKNNATYPLPEFKDLKSSKKVPTSFHFLGNQYPDSNRSHTVP